MKEMKASLQAIGEKLNEKPVRSREGASSNNRNCRGRPSSSEPTRPRQSPETRRCFMHNQQGHLRRDRKRSQGRDQPSLKKGNILAFKSRDSESDDNITGTATINYLGTARIIRREVDIQNHKVNAIIDTGAQVTILNDQFLISCNQNRIQTGKPCFTRLVEK